MSDLNASTGHEKDNRNAPLHARLRRPEHTKFFNSQALKLYETERKINIRPPHEPFTIDDDVDWQINPYKDRTWQLYFHSLVWVNVICYAIDFYQEVDPEKSNGYLAQLHAIFDSNIDAILEQPLSLNSPIWDDHATAYRCSHISYVYERYLKTHLLKRQHDRLLLYIERHVEVLSGFLASGRWNDSNHLLFHVEGIGDAWAVFHDRIPTTGTALDQAVNAVETYLQFCISADGTTGEHASYYQAFLLRRVYDTEKYFAGIGCPLKAKMEQRLRRGTAFLWTIMPRWGVLPGFGDAQYEKPLALSLVEPFMTDEWRNEELKRWKQPKEATAPARLEHYYDNGFHIFRNGKVTAPNALYSLFLEKRQKGPHGHWDGGSFLTYWGGEPFLVDSGGPYKYGDPMRFNYFQAQIAHNTVAFGSAGEKYIHRIYATEVSDDLAWVAGEAKFESGARWLRVFGHFRTNAVVIVDLAQGIDGQDPVALFHLASHLAINRGSHTLGLGGEKGICRMTFGNDLGQQRLKDATSERTYPSYITKIDTQFEKSQVFARRLAPARPAMTVLSFAQTTAGKVEIVDRQLRISLSDQGTPLTMSVPLSETWF